MLNNIFSILNNFYLFINLNLKNFFILFFILFIFFISQNKNNINFFFNIFIFIVISSIFLFLFNIGAYSGFLFLCEIVSVFTLYILLNKINYIIFNKYKINLNIYFIFLFSVFLYYTNAIGIENNFYLYFDNYYLFNFLNSNDFLTILFYFYYNVYFIFLFITFTLIILSIFIILSIKNYLKFNNDNKYINIFKNLFNYNNNISIKIKTNLNFFKKKC